MRLDAGEPLIDIGDEAKPTHLAIGDDVDTAFGLFFDHLGDGAFDAGGIASGVERPALLFRQVPDDARRADVKARRGACESARQDHLGVQFQMS